MTECTDDAVFHDHSQIYSDHWSLLPELESLATFQLLVIVREFQAAILTKTITKISEVATPTSTTMLACH